MTDTIENKLAPKRWRDMARRLTPAAEAKASTSAHDPNVEPKPARPVWFSACFSEQKVQHSPSSSLRPVGCRTPLGPR